MNGSREYDAVVAGAGHNGLVAATLLARAGWRVLVLERGSQAGGAAVSASPFAGVDARISRYAYLISLFPAQLLSELGISMALRRRSVSSYTPHGEAGILVSDDAQRTRASFVRTVGSASDWEAMESFYAVTTGVAQRVFGSLTEPLRSRESFQELVGDATAWDELFARPLAETLERCFSHDLVRGIVATDALIGTFASLGDAQLRQNRCFLYHVIGNGTGRWEVPVGGMGALSAALVQAAQAAGAQLRLSTPVVWIEPGERAVRVHTADGGQVDGRHLLAGFAPAVLSRLIGDPADALAPEGSQLKVNLLLSRLPRLRDDSVTAEQAFAGTFHVNEGYEQLGRAFAQAAAGVIPELPPCEAYCHSLTDPSILSDQLRASGAHTLTVFVLHMPARLFGSDHGAAKERALQATLRSLNSVLAEAIEDCLLIGADGEPCLEVRTPVELEAELGLPAGHIFHRDLSWPYAESAAEVGGWGVETARRNVWICGAGARRGGGVSAIPGHNAARAVLAADSG